MYLRPSRNTFQLLDPSEDQNKMGRSDRSISGSLDLSLRAVAELGLENGLG